MNVVEITETCMARGKMTMQKAIALRSSVHVFIGALGSTSLFDAEFKQWMIEHCKSCDQKDCPVKGHLEIKKVKRKVNPQMDNNRFQYGPSVEEFTEICMSFGRMTSQEAAGLLGITPPLSSLEVGKWVRLKCESCTESDCPVYSTVIKK